MQVCAVEDDPPEPPDACEPTAPRPSLDEQVAERLRDPAGRRELEQFLNAKFRVSVPSADQPPVRPAARVALPARLRDKTREEKQSIEKTAAELRAYLKTLSASDDVDSLVEEWLENRDNLPPEDHKFVLLLLASSWVLMQ